MVSMLYDINTIFMKNLGLNGNLVSEILEFLGLCCLLHYLLCHGFLEKTFFSPVYILQHCFTLKYHSSRGSRISDILYYALKLDIFNSCRKTETKFKKSPLT